MSKAKEVVTCLETMDKDTSELKDQYVSKKISKQTFTTVLGFIQKYQKILKGN